MNRSLATLFGTFLVLITALWLATLVGLGYWFLVRVTSALPAMNLGWLTLAKSALAIIILGLVVACLKPTHMIALVGPFAIAEVIYVYARWSMQWDDVAVLLAVLIAVGQISWRVQHL